MNPKKIARKVVPKQGIKLLEKSYRNSRGILWQARYGYPLKSLKVIAVTGTNGKTTSCSYISSVLRAGGLKTAVYTTAYFEIDGKVTPNHTHMTVASQKSVQSFFKKAKEAGVDWVVLEVTSNALHQNRIAGLNPEIGAVTNLTQEHLDYHGTMQNYAKAKALLFTKYGAQTAFLNHDDDWFQFFSDNAPKSQISFGEHKQSKVRLSDIKLGADGSNFVVNYQKSKFECSTDLVGKFNVYNALTAVAIGLELKISPKDIIKGIKNVKAVPGRMEQIDQGQNFSVLVDFAITPDALENVLSTLKPLTKGKLRIVFGATGDRDKTKRIPMGEVVAGLADAIYLTDDETYTEDPEQIRNAVYKGIKNKKAEAKTKIIEDREQAIKQAFKDSKPGDTVLLTGIGHENYRNMGGKKVPWDERQIARKLLKN